MELIDAYVTEVGQRLPGKQRADIEREIRSMIEDTLADESQKQGRPVDEDLLVDVLKRLGPPEKLAASYAQPAYLVGPALYPTYRLVLKLVLGIVLGGGGLAVVIMVGLGAGYVRYPPGLGDVPQGLNQAFLSLLGAGIQVVGMVTLIFALIQRVAPGFRPSKIPVEFNPRALKAPVPQAEPFKPAQLVLDGVLALLALTLFVFYPQVIGMYLFAAGPWKLFPVLTSAFFTYVPFMSFLWVMEFALKGSVLAAGRWTTALRWGALALRVLSIGLLYAMLNGLDLVSLRAPLFNRAGDEFIDQLNYWVNTGLRFAMGIGMVVSTIEVVVKTVKLLFRRRAVFGQDLP